MLNFNLVPFSPMFDDMDNFFNFKPFEFNDFNDCKLRDNGNSYQITLDYDDDNDEINIKTNKKKNLLTIKIREDWHKTDKNSASKHYGQYTMTVPEDCEIDDYKKEVNKENKTITISFNKKEKQTKEENIDYKKEYEELLKKYNAEKTNYKELYDKYEARNKELHNKLREIKSII